MISRRTKRKLKNALRKNVSLLLAFAIIAEITYPTQVLALTGGPSQPEVQSFEPIGTSDMVDIASGDFNYNIPLLDVDGYPINIAYHSGITMDQEASWVGLGWNINPGVINRNMRGLPDDFSGDVVTKEQNIKANKTWGVSSNINFEVYGYPINVGFSNSFSFNNYTGPSVSNGFNISLSASKGCASGSASLGLNSSSDDGLTIQPSVSFSAKMKSGEKSETSLGLNIGTAFNSRGGLKQLTVGTSISNSIKGAKYNSDKEKGAFRSYSKKTNTDASMGGGTSATFDFGMPTFTPSISTSMKNFGISGNFTLGGEIWGVDAKIGVGGFYSCQSLANKNVANPAFGYLYAENGQANDNALMDFNREKDGTFTENTAFLPITNFTFDTYAVSGQGVGGSYRPFRSDIGYVFDPVGYTTNDDDALTVEIGIGGWVHAGTDVSVTDVNGRSGKWKNNNDAIKKLKYSKRGKGNDFENVYFKEANEKSVDDDTAFYAAAGYDAPISPVVDFSDKFEHKLKGFGPITRKKRAKRNQNFSFLKRSEYNDFAVQPVSNTYAAMGHHMAEITTLSTDGSRYVYGIAAYNTLQKEVTFAVGGNDPTTASPRFNALSNDEAIAGTIAYTSTDASTGNQMGEDNYYSATTTPAYAHSYLLTSVLSADYVDADNVRGPSDNDFGSYTRFAYSKVSNYKWRVPFDDATYTEGMKSDLQDDKANYLYGEKELWYLDSVVTKNYIAVFYKSNREDGVGVINEDGGYSAGAKQMKRLDSIALFSKQELRANPTTALPIKCVHFEYTYALCTNIPNTIYGAPDPDKGKLTLKKIFFTYKSSNKARLSPYVFDYHETELAQNPHYNIKSYDRWGNYKQNTATALGVRGDNTDVNAFVSGALPASDFPYVEQDKTSADLNTSAWSLKEIRLPSGGRIKVTYESDDYAYVQNRQAMQMFKIVNYGDTADASNTVVDFATGGLKFYFKLQDGITDIHKYTDNINDLYFRCLVNIRTLGYDHLEYVSGYGEIESSGIEGNKGWIRLKSVSLKDHGGGTNVNPVVKTAIQYARLYMPKKAWTSGVGSLADNAGLESTIGTQILDAMVNSSFIKNIKDAIVGPNQSLYDSYNVGKEFVAGKSWFRLNNPNKHKLGGGVRVKKIEMIDEWGSMINNPAETSNYGQEYDYNLEDGASSGVASYEPQLGGDENPFRQPVYTSVDKLGVPDDQFYQERPVGECFFPTPDITYSRITVKNLQRSGVNRHATGKVVHEFYTSKDFPTITRRTSVHHKRGKDSPFSLVSLLKINARDYLTAAQGFVVELNDMQGKPKSQKVYPEGQSTPISSVEYRYKQENYLSGSYKLTNKCAVIEKNGNISQKRIGEFFDMVADFREDKTETNNTTLQMNIDVIPAGPYPLPIPMMWPSFAKEKTRFRSATSTKVIQRFGILEETIATDLGSMVSTKNLAYDAETGSVLLTETTTNYNDKVYNFKYPAWWYYESMGPAYQNIDFEMNSVIFSATGNASVGTATMYFKEGDEVALTSNIGNIRGWVNSISGSIINVIQKDGSSVSGTYNLRILRSGKRNLTTVDMATVTTLTNPLIALKSNAYDNILQASAIEFSNKRKTYCDCMTNAESNIPYSSNDYINGKKGNWRPLKSYTHLTQRSQSNYDNNTNIRKDGVFTSYTPYYRWVAGSWHQDPKDWTYVSEVSEFNVYGEELENKDALGRFSSATFGYNQSMAVSVAANSMRKEEGFDGFEDYNFNPCADGHFKVDSITPVSTASHTGRYSLKISSGSPTTLSRQLTEVCTDSSGCALSINVTETSSTVFDMAVSSGQAPYSYDWEIVSGSPAVTLTSGGARITGTAYRVELTVRDNKGCATTKIIKN